MATCKTCPFWERDPANDRPGIGYCHHALTAADDTNESARYEQFWCSEHPLRQRDRLAAMAMQGFLASLTDPNFDPDPPGVARMAYRVADAMLTEAKKGLPHG